MEAIDPHLDAGRSNWDFVLTLPEYERRKLKMTSMKHLMSTKSLFEFSGACSG